MRKSVWSHHKYSNREYAGSYQRVEVEDKNTKVVFEDRIFVLTAFLKNKKPHVLEFESHQMAKSMGWVKLK